MNNNKKTKYDTTGIKHYIDAADDYYLVIDGKIKLTISLDKNKKQIIMSTPTTVYAGPIDFIQFNEFPNYNKN